MGRDPTRSAKAGPANGGARRGRGKPPPGKLPKRAPAARSPTSGSEPPGLGARRLAAALIERVLIKGRALDDGLEAPDGGRPHVLEARDRGFARLIAATVLRRLGSLDAILGRHIERPLPPGARARTILLMAAAQILVLGTPAHAAIHMAVEQCRRDPRASRLDKLANAVLRKVAAEGAEALAGLDAPRIDIPDWMWQRWCQAYGEDVARQIAAASLREAPLDLSVKAESGAWAARLGGRALGPGTVRLGEHGRIEELAGYADGGWWVQDFAAALPARLLGDVAGLEVADLCAAPGGKAAALATAGARVTAVDISASRLERLAANMRRLGLADRVEGVAADIEAWSPGRLFDAVLLDAPCTSTGTIRRHPDILHLKRPGDAERLAALQRRLLDRASLLLGPGGTLVYCVCSMEPEEGEAVVEAFLATHSGWVRRAVTAAEIGADPAWISAAGDLRTLPCHAPAGGTDAAAGGMDGFYAARLVRRDG